MRRRWLENASISRSVDHTLQTEGHRIDLDEVELGPEDGCLFWSTDPYTELSLLFLGAGPLGGDQA